MTKSKFLIPLICLFLLAFNIFISVDINSFKNTTPAYNSAQGGIGVGIKWGLTYLATCLVCGITLLWIILKERADKNNFQISKESLLNIILIVITLVIPVILVVFI